MSRARRSAPGVGSNDLLVFGYAVADASLDAKRHITELAILLGRHAGVDVSLAPLPSYERVTQLLHKREIDLAWVPPIPFVSLLRNDSVQPLLVPWRGATHYHSAVIVPIESTLKSPARLGGLRAAWVDKYSAAGFVLPRIQLAAIGVDPRTAFPEQRFFGSHVAVVRAVIDGLADFGATYVRLGKKGEIVSGPWAQSPTLAASVRVLTTFGEIPADVIAARVDLSAPLRERLISAFAQVARDPAGKDLVRRVFGADELRRPQLSSYDVLRDAVADAFEEGLLDVDEEIDDDDLVAAPDDTIETKMVFIDETAPQRPRAASSPAAPRPRAVSSPKITQAARPRAGSSPKITPAARPRAASSPKIAQPAQPARPQPPRPQPKTPAAPPRKRSPSRP